MYQILLDAAKAALSKKFLDINNYIKKQKTRKTSPDICPGMGLLDHLIALFLV